MPKYLIQASYTVEGAKGLLKDGGSKRKTAAEAAAKAVGGSIDAFYYAFGDHDAYIIADIPDNVSAMALSVVVNSAGGVAAKTTPLLTVEDMDKAIKKKIVYAKP